MVESLQDLALSLEPGKVAACSVHVARRAADAAAAVTSDAEQHVSCLRGELIAQEGDATLQQHIKEAEEALSRAQAHEEQVSLAVMARLGPTVVHALLHLAAMEQYVFGLRRLRASRHRPQPEVRAALQWQLAQAEDQASATLGKHLSGHKAMLLHAVAHVQLRNRCTGVAVDGKSYVHVRKCWQHRIQEGPCQSAKQAWLTACAAPRPRSHEHTVETLQQVADELCSAAADVRRQVLTLQMHRLVSQHLASIKERLWRPQGRLVQKRKAALLVGQLDAHVDGSLKCRCARAQGSQL